MSNRISLCATVLSVDTEQQELLCRIGHNKNPLVCQCKEKRILSEIEVGKRLIIHGQLCSRDRCAWNPCFCRTTHDEIESYLLVDAVTKEVQSDAIANKETINYVSLTGYVVGLPQQIQTLQHSFFSIRVKLSDNNGYVTFTYTSEIAPKRPVVLGQEVLLTGRVKAKDYEKRAVCPCCGETYFHPILSILVIAESILW